MPPPAALRPAAEPALARIRRDRRRAPERVKPLLAYLEPHLFDRGLTVARWRRECGVRDPDVLRQLTDFVGRTPYAYIEDRRMETACRLLAETRLQVARVADLLGYGSARAFSRAFSRWTGVRPSFYRDRGKGRTSPRAPHDPEGLLREALALADQAIELARSAGDEAVVADFLIRKAKILSRAGDPAGIAILEEALALMRE